MMSGGRGGPAGIGSSGIFMPLFGGRRRLGGSCTSASAAVRLTPLPSSPVPGPWVSSVASGRRTSPGSFASVASGCCFGWSVTAAPLRGRLQACSSNPSGVLLVWPSWPFSLASPCRSCGWSVAVAALLSCPRACSPSPTRSPEFPPWSGHVVPAVTTTGPSCPGGPCSSLGTYRSCWWSVVTASLLGCSCTCSPAPAWSSEGLPAPGPGCGGGPGIGVCLPRRRLRLGGGPSGGSLPGSGGPGQTNPIPLSWGALALQATHSQPSGSCARLGLCSCVSSGRPVPSRCAVALLAHLVRFPLSATCCLVHLPPGFAGASSPILACLVVLVLWPSAGLHSNPRPLRRGPTRSRCGNATPSFPCPCRGRGGLGGQRRG